MNGYGGFDLRFPWICCLCCYEISNVILFSQYLLIFLFSQESINFIFKIGPLFKGPLDWSLKWHGGVGPVGPNEVGLGGKKKTTCLVNG